MENKFQITQKSYFSILLIFCMNFMYTQYDGINEDYYYIKIERLNNDKIDINPKNNSKHRRIEGKLYVGYNRFDELTYLGDVYENCAYKIPPAAYKGKIRRGSTKERVLDLATNSLGFKGDFYLEVDVINGDIHSLEPPRFSEIRTNFGRTNILFHSGTKAYHSLGCILVGPYPPGGQLTNNHILKKLKDFIYNKNYSEPKNIVIEITQNQTFDCSVN